MFLNEKLRLTVNTGPLKGRQFGSLLDFLDAQAEHEASCPHEHTRSRRVVSGMATDHPHLNTGVVCKDCGKVLESNRQRISHSMGRRIRVEDGKI